MARSFRSLALVAASIVALPAAACKCEPRPVEAAFADASLVFVATITDLSAGGPRLAGAPPPPVRGGFRVLERFKGDPGRLKQIATRLGRGDCGLNLSAGHRYLFYLDHAGRPIPCAGSREIERGDVDDARLLIRLRTLALARAATGGAPSAAQPAPRNSGSSSRGNSSSNASTREARDLP